MVVIDIMCTAVRLFFMDPTCLCVYWCYLHCTPKLRLNLRHSSVMSLHIKKKWKPLSHKQNPTLLKNMSIPKSASVIKQVSYFSEWITTKSQ